MLYSNLVLYINNARNKCAMSDEGHETRWVLAFCVLSPSPRRLHADLQFALHSVPASLRSVRIIYDGGLSRITRAYTISRYSVQLYVVLGIEMKECCSCS